MGIFEQLRTGVSSGASNGAPWPLHTILFSAIAVVVLGGSAAIVEVSIHAHRDLAVESLERLATELTIDVARSNSDAILAGEEQALRAMASDLMRRSEITFIRVQSSQRKTPYTIARSGTIPPNKSVMAQASKRINSKLVQREDAFVIDVIVPLSSIVSAIPLEDSPDRTHLSPLSSFLAIGYDVTEDYAGLRAAANRVRATQAGVAAIMLFAIWVGLRKAFRPFEEVSIAAHKIGKGQRCVDFPPPSTREMERLTLGLVEVQHRLERRVGGIPRLGPRLGTANPPAAAAPPAVSRQTVKESASGSPTDSHRPESSRLAHHILLVEDNPVNRSVAVDMLEALGCSVVCAEDGEASLVAIEAEPFDLVLMDIQMPGMDGLEATRRIRAEEERVGATPTPIVALTAHSQLEDRIASAEAGMEDHISKPFTSRDLEIAMLKWCGSNKTEPNQPG